MFEQTFKNIDDILHKDAGCSSELDYVEQTSWILFLKYLDDLEKDKKTVAKLAGKTYTGIISPEYRWEVGCVPCLKGEIPDLAYRPKKSKTFAIGKYAQRGFFVLYGV